MTEDVTTMEVESHQALPKRGRPRAAKPLDRTVVVRFDADQYAQIESAAQTQGVSISAYIRARASATNEVSDAEPQTAEDETVVSTAEQGMYDKGKIRSRQIAAKALEAYSQMGFNNVSLREIASRCGVSHQALMHYFPTKDDLIRAALELRDDRLVQHFADGVNADELITLAEENASRPGHVAMFNMAAAEASAPEHTAHSYYTDFYRDLVRALAVGLDKGAQGSLTRARLLLAMMDGLQLQWLFAPGAFSVADLLAQGAASLGIKLQHGKSTESTQQNINDA